MHRIDVISADVNVLGKTAADGGAMNSSGRSWTTILEEQATWSSADATPDADVMLPKWSCRLGSKQEVEQLCERMTFLCTAPLAQGVRGKAGFTCFCSAYVQPRSYELTVLPTGHGKGPAAQSLGMAAPGNRVCAHGR